MDGRIEVVQGDITTLAVDAVVDAANSALVPGGGVDGAIRRAAGEELDAAAARLGGCPPGEARVTGGYRLPAKHVIFTVGPMWQGGGGGEREVLARCYRNSLRLAVENGLRTLAFPSISTGVYGFPVEAAAEIALREIGAFLAGDRTLERVTIVCFDGRTVEAYRKAREG